MANEISVSFSISLTKGGATTRKSFSGTFDQTGTGYVQGIQAIGTSEEAIALGDVTTPGWFYIKNLDATNYVTIGETVNNDIIKLKAGEATVGRFGITAPYAIANTATCNIEYLIMQD